MQIHTQIYTHTQTQKYTHIRNAQTQIHKSTYIHAHMMSSIEQVVENLLARNVILVVEVVQSNLNIVVVVVVL